MNHSHQHGIPALELIEEATSLLRRAPLEVLALYYLGTLPFIMALLFFWADMSRAVDAADRLAAASLVVALLFIWMKYWQARFCRELSRLVVNASSAPPATEVLLTQATLQPWGFFALPAALLITLPFGWCFAFFQNVAVIGGAGETRQVIRAARRQASLWPRQNHMLLFIFILLGLVVFANLCIGIAIVPKLLKTLLGVESMLTRSSLYLLNSTFWAAMFGLTHLCIDPLIKASYLLRCHYGDSLASGADLLAELREVTRSSATALTILGAILLCTLAPPALAAPDAPKQAVSAQKLEKAIAQVISGPEFAWRLPRTAQQQEELPGFMQAALHLVKKWSDGAGRIIKRFLHWLEKKIRDAAPDGPDLSGNWRSHRYLYPAVFTLSGLCICVGLLLLRRQALRKQKVEPVEPAAEPVIEPDLKNENVLADELSEEVWHALAQELFAKGELRLALRALYLASLAFLARERVLSIARFKSNREYEREVGRFGESLPEVAASFSSNVAVYERAWYGLHLPEQGTVETFRANYQRIVSRVRQG